MVVICAFYGFVNRTTKVRIEVNREDLEVGRVVAFEGDNYVILSLFEADGIYHANVSLEHVHRAKTLLRSKSPNPTVVEADEHGGRGNGQVAVLQARLKAAESRLQRVLQERDEALKLLDRAVRQLDRLHHSDGP
jgi:hypothetical protein